MPKYFFELIAITGLSIIIIFYSTVGAGLSSNLPIIGVFSLALLKLMPTIKNLGTINRAFMADLPNAEAAYLALKEMKPNIKTTKQLLEIENFSKKLVFKDVSFGYSSDGPLLLNNASFSINSGEFVGIVGQSGSGKTTVLDLITNLLKPTSGEILIDDTPLKEISDKSISKLIGYVGQDPFFFHGTIRDNILFGRNNYSDKDVEETLSKVEMLDYLNSKNEKLDFVLADSGLKISGGQRQRLNIARALIASPKILILDESTSNLDSKTEKKMVSTILSLVKKYSLTVIFVTHRLSAVKKADKIVEIEDSKILINDNKRIQNNKKITVKS